MCVHQDVCVEVRGQFVEVRPLLVSVSCSPRRQVNRHRFVEVRPLLVSVSCSPRRQANRHRFGGAAWGSTSFAMALGYSCHMLSSVLIYSQSLGDFNQDTNIVILGFGIGFICLLWVTVEAYCEVNHSHHIWGFAQGLRVSQGSSRKENLF